MALVAKAEKLLRLGRQEWRDLFVAQFLLLRAWTRLRTRPVGSLVDRGAELRAEAPTTGTSQRAHALGIAVARAARFGVFRPKCLTRAIALRELLVRDGIHGATVRVGVRRDATGFQAHAWVRWSGHVVGDSPTWVAQFTEVDDLRVLGDS